MKRGTISSATDSNSKRVRKETVKISSFSKYYKFQLIIKRGRISKRARKRKGKVSHIIKTHEYSGTSFFDLPRDILLNILVRLPVKRILVSKIVCKTWYELISDHEFAKLYSDQAESYPLIHTKKSGMVYLMQPDKTDFDLKLGMCDDHCSFKPGCVCNVKVKIDTKFQLPKSTKNEVYEYCIVNSCNGLLYLYNKDKIYDYYKDCHHIVCNPITGEFINVPVPQAKDNSFCYNSGFGFSPASNQYKVIKIYEPYYTEVGTTIAEVHVIGTKTWKQIGYCINSIPVFLPIYLNGFLYWSSGTQEPLSLISFDIASESFELVLGPATDEWCISVSVGVLGGELCISSGFLNSGVIHVWTMKDYGTEKEWSKVFSFKLNSFRRRYCGSLQPLTYLNDEALMMFYTDTNSLVYIDPKTNRMRCLKVRRIESLIAHIPSFVSLKHTLSGQNVKVLNVNSRCAELKRQGETEDIFLVEEEFCPK